MDDKNLIMITEDYVSYEIARLLKEKGFNEPCTGLNKICFKDGEKPVLKITHQKLMKWLREVYHIEIHITFGFPYNSLTGKSEYKYFWSIVKVCGDHLEYPMNKPDSMEYHEEQANKYEEAIEAALKYTLNNLI